MTFALYYQADAYSISKKKLMGRNAAGSSFLRALLDYGFKDKEVVSYTESDACSRNLEDIISQHHRQLQLRQINKLNMGALAASEGLYYPGPDISRLANYRSLFSCYDWSLCGITHTTSSAAAMDAVASWATSPVYPWDAIICTSSAVKSNVEVVLQAQIDLLQERLGITRIVLPQLPIIPLGIHTNEFSFSAKEKVAARQRIGASTDALVVLYTGRL